MLPEGTSPRTTHEVAGEDSLGAEWTIEFGSSSLHANPAVRILRLFGQWILASPGVPAKIGVPSETAVTTLLSCHEPTAPAAMSRSG